MATKIEDFIPRKSVTVKTLKSLKGLFNRACAFITLALTFNRRLYDQTISLKKTLL